MKTALWIALICILSGTTLGQALPTSAAQSEPARPKEDIAATSNRGSGSAAEVEDLRRALQQLKALLSQMRTNLAFVQTSQTPLKHQFELEADAWQVIVEQMDRRLKRLEERHDQAGAQRDENSRQTMIEKR